MKEIQNVAEQFLISGKITNFEHIKKGYINDTYRIITISESKNVHQYILQRINTNVFPNVDILMHN